VIRRSIVLALAAVLLASCATQTLGSALTKWMTQSSFSVNTSALRLDAAHAAKALRNPTTSAASLHTVCGVLDFDTEAANAALPTPDAQLNATLAQAYNALGDGASLCYHAAASRTTRAAAVNYLIRGVGGLAEGLVRASVVTN
jgi:hypothetical protein